ARAASPEFSGRVAPPADPAVAGERLATISDRLRAAIGPYCYGEGAVTMEETVGALLRARGLTVATAWPCTGGLVAHRLTNVPGSSAYVVGGVVAYANEAKRRLLDVGAATLEAHGAVSEQTAAEMAAGARRALGADIVGSRTGVAGGPPASAARSAPTPWSRPRGSPDRTEERPRSRWERCASVSRRRTTPWPPGTSSGARVTGGSCSPSHAASAQ